MPTLEEIRLMPRRYAIGKRPLSLVLGWGELTYTRMLEGNSPTEEHLCELRRLVDDPAVFARRLQTGRSRITEAAYERSLKAVDELLEGEGGVQRATRIFAVADRLCALAGGDLTPGALQRLVYFAHGLALARLDAPLFDDLPRAADSGPEYDRIGEYGFDEIRRIGMQPIPRQGKKAGRKGATQPAETEGSPLNAEEIAIVDLAYSTYGEYSGQKLAQLSRESTPWKKARKRAGATETGKGDAPITAKSMRKYFAKR